MIKIKKPLLRVLAVIITLLFALAAGIGFAYGVGLVSPLTSHMLFVMIFGIPDIFEIMVSGVITMIPIGVIGLFFWAIYKLAKYLNRFYS